ncbi:MAG: right-handed parallel beta-helix repeat-containing protein [Planctomycetota bacterium]|jgi:hypothetical protein
MRDDIEATEGSYSETVDFKGKAVTVRSTDPNDWAVVGQTTINPDSAHGAYFHNSEDANSVLSGFTISTSGDIGVYCTSSSTPVIQKCIIKDNFTGVHAGPASPVVRNSKISNNNTGILAIASAPDILNSWIYENNYGITFAARCFGRDSSKQHHRG